MNPRVDFAGDLLPRLEVFVLNDSLKLSVLPFERSGRSSRGFPESWSERLRRLFSPGGSWRSRWTVSRVRSGTIPAEDQDGSLKSR